MSAIRSTGGKTEVRLRSMLHRRGLRFRKNVKDLPGKPDIVFSKPKVAVFIDGDYWHGRAIRETGWGYFDENFKSENKLYWRAKLERNIGRDAAVTEQLGQSGWLVLRFWESDVKKNTENIAGAIEAAVRSRK